MQYLSLNLHNICNFDNTTRREHLRRAPLKTSNTARPHHHIVASLVFFVPPMFLGASPSLITHPVRLPHKHFNNQDIKAAIVPSSQYFRTSPAPP
mmetsp:Transcript_27158/g.51549  ORF Transcript_27158/g.51549 Transcript_27158/m.51549 type:complete len:95 (+) Transcript_27158:2-286(+)